MVEQAAVNVLEDEEIKADELRAGIDGAAKSWLEPRQLTAAIMSTAPDTEGKSKGSMERKVLRPSTRG